MIEGWHRAFHLLVTIKHSTLHRHVKRLRKEQGDKELIFHDNAAWSCFAINQEKVQSTPKGPYKEI